MQPNHLNLKFLKLEVLSNIPYKIPFPIHPHIIHKGFISLLVMAFTHSLLACFLVSFSLTISAYPISPSYGYGAPKPTNPSPSPSYGYGPKHTSAGPPPSYGYGPKPNSEEMMPRPQEQEHYNTIGVQGLVYCRSGSKFGPLEGKMIC